MAYTPGYSAQTTAFMARRSLETHGAFIVPLLRSDLIVLDLGCGPGTLTLDLARQMPLGRVLGVDRSKLQIAQAIANAKEAQITNVGFFVAEAGSTNLPEQQFDLIFSHALFEHLPDPVTVLRTSARLLRSGGEIALRSPDWGGWVLYPETRNVAEAIAAYGALQEANGGDTHAGRKLGAWLMEAGFTDLRRSASYEIYPSARLIADYLGRQLDLAGAKGHADSLRRWAESPGAVFAQSWFEAIARKR